MLTEEYGCHYSHVLRRAALTTFNAFAACELVPLIPFLVGLANAFEFSIVVTGAVFFVIRSDRDEDRARRILEKAERHCLIANSVKTQIQVEPEISVARDFVA